MIDYLIVYPDDAVRAAAFPPPEDKPPCWSIDDGTAMPVRIVISDAVMSEDGATVIVPAVYGAGSWMAVRCDERAAEIEALPNCMLCTDAALAAEGLSYVHFCRLEPETVMGRVEPVFAGDGYPFRPGEPASALDAWLIAA